MKTLFELRGIKTSDGINLVGAVATPKKRGKTAALWVHGLTGSFYSTPKRLSAIAAALNKNGTAFAAFNNRGHDIATSFKRNGGKSKTLIAGGSFEIFTDCLKDIKAAIQFLRHEGYKNIYLVGHSTGANKCLYYVAHTQDKNVKGLALVGPLSDLATEKDRLGASFGKNLKRVQEYSKKNDSNWPMPKNLCGSIMSPQRYLSLNVSGKPEDVFRYHDPKASWGALNKIRIPLAVIIGQKDQHLGSWRAEDLVDTFADNAIGAPEFSGIVIPRADHSFTKTYKELGKELAGWIKNARR
jgi:pimeloyl-ACP methyl ester carboxylesterase